MGFEPMHIGTTIRGLDHLTTGAIFPTKSSISNQNYKSRGHERFQLQKWIRAWPLIYYSNLKTSLKGRKKVWSLEQVDPGFKSRLCHRLLAMVSCITSLTSASPSIKWCSNRTCLTGSLWQLNETVQLRCRRPAPDLPPEAPYAF